MKKLDEMSFEELNNEIKKNDINTKEKAQKLLYEKYLKRFDQEHFKDSSVKWGFIGLILLCVTIIIILNI